ncbi:MAG: SEC-C metal-binding domain-containing protein, partial [Terriglobales bacterium]
GEPGLNYLCAGYKAFFNHIDAAMKIMAGLLRQGRFADEIMQMSISPNTRNATARTKVGRNDPCLCGSGRKFKHCHGGTAESAVRQ